MRRLRQRTPLCLGNNVTESTAIVCIETRAKSLDAGRFHMFRKSRRHHLMSYQIHMPNYLVSAFPAKLERHLVAPSRSCRHLRCFAFNCRQRRKKRGSILRTRGTERYQSDKSCINLSPYSMSKKVLWSLLEYNKRCHSISSQIEYHPTHSSYSKSTIIPLKYTLTINAILQRDPSIFAILPVDRFRHFRGENKL
jgi:hypothetical protein